MNTNNSAGIDYGMGQTNIDFKTGIRYGVISLDSVNPFFLDKFEPIYSSEEPQDFEEPIAYIYNDDKIGLKCEYDPNSSLYMLWVFHSPVTEKVKFCSPCVPGAGDLNNPCENGIEAYSLPKDCLVDL